MIQKKNKNVTHTIRGQDLLKKFWGMNVSVIYLIWAYIEFILDTHLSTVCSVQRAGV